MAEFNCQLDFGVHRCRLARNDGLRASAWVLGALIRAAIHAMREFGKAAQTIEAIQDRYQRRKQASDMVRPMRHGHEGNDIHSEQRRMVLQRFNVAYDRAVALPAATDQPKAK